MNAKFRLLLLFAIFLLTGNAFAAAGHGNISGSAGSANHITDRRSNYNYWDPNDQFGPSGSALTRGYYGPQAGVNDLSNGNAATRGNLGAPDSSGFATHNWPSDPIRYPDQAPSSTDQNGLGAINQTPWEGSQSGSGGK